VFALHYVVETCAASTINCCCWLCQVQEVPRFGSARHALFGVRSSSSRATHRPFTAVKSSFIVSASARPLELDRIWIPALWQLPQKARGSCSPYTVPLRPAPLRPSTAASGCFGFGERFRLFSADASGPESCDSISSASGWSYLSYFGSASARPLELERVCVPTFLATAPEG
jgi:hypothetical protein